VNAELIGPSDPRWCRLLQQVPHDVYHLPEYVAFAARQEGGAPRAFYVETSTFGFLLPLLVRELPAELDAPPDWRDASSPYGFFSAPLATDPGDTGALLSALEAFREVGRDQGIVSAFIRLHPVRALAGDPFARAGRLHTHGRVVYVDLSRSLEELWSQTRENHRSGIKKLTRAGFVPAMDRWDLYGDFVRLYRETMERASATSFYFFSDAYFEDLRVTLGDRLHLCSVVSPQSEVASAGLFCAIDGAVQYHLGGTAGPYLSKAPSKLMFDFVRRWGKERGAATLHLGGGLGAVEDSLFHFKAGFSPLGATCQTFRMILDEDRYSTLHARWTERCAPSDGDLSDFFPVYRRPRAGPASP
jgi:hypothetical protein